MIKFNKVTWYSKLAAIVFFIGILPTLTFFIGAQYQEVKNLNLSETSIQISKTPTVRDTTKDVSTSPDASVVKDLKVSLVKAGGNSGYEKKENIVVNNQEQWKDTWNKVYSTYRSVPELPSVDFSKSTIIAAFAGTIASGGYSIEIVKVEEKADKVAVTVQSTVPGKMCATTSSLSEPFYIGQIPKITKPVTFISTTKVVNCDR